MNEIRIVALLWALLGMLCSACVSAQTSNNSDPREPLRDFFFYRCVHEYPEAQDFAEIDGSVAFVADYLTERPETIKAISARAKAFAVGLRRSEYTGKVAVLALCLEEARGLDLSGLKN